jgi:hypothetical protein
MFDAMRAFLTHRVIAVLVAASAWCAYPSAAQSPFIGNWQAVFVDSPPNRPKMFTTVTFSIRQLPDGQLAGTAVAGVWPGDLEVVDLKVEGEKISFTGVGSRPWSGVTAGVFARHCCPRLVFEGSMRGDQMELVLTWPPEDGGAGGPPLPMRADRVKP